MSSFQSTSSTASFILQQINPNKGENKEVETSKSIEINQKKAERERIARANGACLEWDKKRNKKNAAWQSIGKNVVTAINDENNPINNNLKNILLMKLSREQMELLGFRVIIELVQIYTTTENKSLETCKILCSTLYKWMS